MTLRFLAVVPLLLISAGAQAQQTFQCGRFSKELEVSVSEKSVSFTLDGTFQIEMGKVLGLDEEPEAVKVVMPAKNCTKLQGRLIQCYGVVESLSYQPYWTGWGTPFEDLAPQDMYLNIREVKQINVGNFGKVENVLEVQVVNRTTQERSVFVVPNECR